MPIDLDRLAALDAAPALIDAGVRTAALTHGGVSAALQGRPRCWRRWGVGPTSGLAGPCV